MRLCYLVPGSLAGHPHGAGEAELRARYLERVAPAGAAVELRDDPQGPKSVESEEAERAAAARLGVLLPDIAAAGFDAAVVGCYGDPGLVDARRRSAIPVVGPAEASLRRAGAAGRPFAVLTVVQDVVPLVEALVRRYGHAPETPVIAVDIPVLELRRRRDETLARLLTQGAAMVDAGAEAVALGCMTMGFLDLASEMEDRLGVPVVNPVVAALEDAAAAGRSAVPASG